MYLRSVNGNGFETLGNRLYFKSECGLYDGTGLILGPNRPFKNIFVLGMI